METDPPVAFGEPFLSWLRETTERAWKHTEEWSFEEYRESRRIGARWRRNTRWTGGLDDSAIAQVESDYGLQFPEQYKLFLQTLHSTTPSRRGVQYEDTGLVPYEPPGFYNWLRDGDQIRAQLDAVSDRSFADAFKVQHGGDRWTDGGPSPSLIPIFGHRYVLCDDTQWVLSIVDEDAIVYGYGLRDYLLSELDDVLR